MAHSSSAQKRIKIAERNRIRNQSVKSKVKTMVKKFIVTLDSKDLEAAKQALIAAQKELDKAVSKGIIHKNAAARKKSRLSLSLNKIVSA